MPMAWRIVRPEHVANAFDGEGARAHGGRWNSKGTSVVYTAGSLSLAALELLAHLESYEVLDGYVCIGVQLSDDFVGSLAPDCLPPDWSQEPAPLSTREVGDAWIAGKPINYYYYGQLMLGILGKTCGVAPHYAFNLACAAVPALAVMVAFGIVYNLSKRILPGILAGVFIGFAGNFQSFARMGHNFIAFGSKFLRPETLGLDGQLIALFVIVLAAGEAAVALAIALNFYNNFTTIDVDRADDLKG